MGTWGEVEQELLNRLLPNGTPDFDAVRRGHLRNLADYTGHSVIVYETAASRRHLAPHPTMSRSLLILTSERSWRSYTVCLRACRWT